MDVDHVVAVRLSMDDGSNRYFLALGRIFDAVEPDKLLAAVTDHAKVYDLQGTVASVHLCEMLREAADSSEAPYYFEAAQALGRVSIPFGKRYAKWQRRTRKAMRRGEHIHYCGGPARG
ncbi:hypothetical protein [uncultured Jatrophihabitans sp.]|uniref:hypothetical protein n=1 Tax=uncultured Jatrophihabitans sp. TaxID=1610747 RepID=UPI0035C9BF7D